MLRFARLLAVLSFCVLISASLHAACTVSLAAPTQVQSDQQYNVAINSAGSGYLYVLNEDWPGRLFFDQMRHASIDQQGVPFTRSYRHRTTFDITVVYRVIATNSANPSDFCVGQASVLVKADPELDRVTRRGIVPVVGTTGGLNNALFKTSLKLTGSELSRGRLIFHPLGRQGSDSDPSIPYSFTGPGLQTLVFDDLMAAFGLFGVGSLDIVPEGDPALPTAEVRIYNQSAEGTFGTMEPMLIAAEWVGFERPPEQKGQGSGLTVGPISEGTRVNLGIRGVTQASFTLIITHADGTRSSGGPFAIQADTMRMGTPSQLIAPFSLPDLVAGDVVAINTTAGAIPFYTVTDNRTNDPAITFPVLASKIVGRYND